MALSLCLVSQLEPQQSTVVIQDLRWWESQLECVEVIRHGVERTQSVHVGEIVIVYTDIDFLILHNPSIACPNIPRTPGLDPYFSVL